MFILDKGGEPMPEDSDSIKRWIVYFAKYSGLQNHRRWVHGCSFIRSQKAPSGKENGGAQGTAQSSINY